LTLPPNPLKGAYSLPGYTGEGTGEGLEFNLKPETLNLEPEKI